MIGAKRIVRGKMSELGNGYQTLVALGKMLVAVCHAAPHLKVVFGWVIKDDEFEITIGYAQDE